MSFFSSLTKQSKLDKIIKQTAEARKSEGTTADFLFKSSYQGYADILLDDPIRAEALYQWGFALLHHAKSKQGDEAIELYKDAISKFAFCLLINPNYLGAAINGGVAYMDLARLTKVDASDVLYDQAKEQFEKANSIQAGTASYNLACIYSLRGDEKACLKALEKAHDKVTLPDVEEILNDPDMENVKNHSWFIEFIDSLTKNNEIDNETETTEKQVEIPPQPEVEETQISHEIITE